MKFLADFIVVVAVSSVAGLMLVQLLAYFMGYEL